MNVQRVRNAFLGVLMLASLCRPQGATAASTSDLSDLWWIPTESGWGIQFVQQRDTVFATMFVYGPNGQPTWYTATLLLVAFPTWSGTLYATTGPWFGTNPFDPTKVTVTAVGTMTFNWSDIRFGTLVYTINGLQVAKQIQRQNLATENFGGTYSGTVNQHGDSNGVACQPPVYAAGVPATFQISQNGSDMTIVTQTSLDKCTFPGTYSQAGHFGLVFGSYTCASGDSGTFQFFEMATSEYDFRARTIARSVSGCIINGYADGLRQ